MSEIYEGQLIIAKDFRVSEIDHRMFGSFVEHLGRCVYGGIYEPGHSQSDELGFRKDVAHLVRELGVTLVRYPGGNFVSEYKWEDVIGFPENRPKRMDLAWRTIESNQVGLNEFVQWARIVGVEVNLATNLGTRGIEEARSPVEYCNHPGGTIWSDLRISHGYREPHNIKIWCLGNEMDGTWQIDQKTTTEYDRLACETAKVIKWIDPNVELVVCGSSSSEMPNLESIANYDEQNNELVIFAVNRSSTESLHLSCDLRSFSRLKIVEHILMECNDIKTTNTKLKESVKHHKNGNARVNGFNLRAVLPRLSWNVPRLNMDE